jgi:hypothetical protein
MTSRQRLFDFAFLVLWILVSILLAGWSFVFEGEDFNVFHAAARITLDGGNPYDYSELAKAMQDYGKVNNPYYYAPWFNWAMLPFALLPFDAARFFWSILNLVLWILALLNTGKLIPNLQPGWKRWGMYTLVTILFAWTTWGFDQVGILIYYLMTLALLDLTAARWNSAGIWMALLLFKPNITALPVAAICAWLLFQKRNKPVYIMLAVIAGMLLLSLVVTPGWYLALLQPDKLTGLQVKFDESGSEGILRYHTTLPGWLATFGVEGTASQVIYGAVAAITLIAVARTILQSNPLLPVASTAILANFLITPYALYYDYPILTLPLFFANWSIDGNPRLRYIKTGLNALIFASLFIGTTISHRYWTAVLVACLFALGIYGSRIESGVIQKENR